jgi:hypothetical protein
MATKLGSVIVFRGDISKDVAEKALRELVYRGLIEDPGCPPHVYNNGKTVIPGHSGVHEFDDCDGNCGPVWYLP